jgi:hypothetical protein
VSLSQKAAYYLASVVGKKEAGALAAKLSGYLRASLNGMRRWSARRIFGRADKATAWALM